MDSTEKPEFVTTRNRGQYIFEISKNALIRTYNKLAEKLNSNGFPVISLNVSQRPISLTIVDHNNIEKSYSIELSTWSDEGDNKTFTISPSLFINSIKNQEPAKYIVDQSGKPITPFTVSLYDEITDEIKKDIEDYIEEVLTLGLAQIAQEIG